MAQNRKILGMTTQQIAILGGLVALVCVLFTVAGCFFLQGAPRMFAPAPQNTLPPQATATPFVLPTLAPTETFTPVPYEMLIPQDWVQFKTALVEIWLPKEFNKQKPSASDEPVSSVTMELSLIGTTPGSSIAPAVVMVSYEPLTIDSLDTYVDLSLANMPAEYRVTDRRKVSLNSTEAFRILIETRIEGMDVNAMMYILRDGNTAWILYYFAQINDFYTMLETFEKSAKTFRVVR